MRRRPMWRAERALTPCQAVALGLMQGPAELLPISSSAHTTLIPWLAGWRYAELDGARRKSFEVALHAGAGAALAIEMRAELVRAAATTDRRRAVALALSLLPAALVGYVLRGPIERRLGEPRSIARGLIAGALAMALADARPTPGARSCADAGARDGLVLGIAQALALIPGVSRSGATRAAARTLGFGREDAQALSWAAGLPVLLGVSAFEGLRMARREASREALPALALGGAAAFLSTLLSARLIRRAGAREKGRPDAGGGRALLPYALYRCALAVLVLRRLRRSQ